MRFWVVGKLTGATVGLMVGGPVGALVGGVLGHVVDHLTVPEDPDEALAALRPPPPTSADIDTQARLAFSAHLVALFAAVARCDGAVRREEIRAIRAFFADRLRLDPDDLEFIRELLKASLGRDLDVSAACAYYDANSTPAERLLFLQALYEVALGDGELVPPEQRLINQIAGNLGISEEDHRTVRSLFFTEEPTVHEDYRLLGVEPGCDDAALKKAYRRLAAKHHPDKVAHLGPDAVALAGHRFGEVKGAYDRIRAVRDA